MNTEKITEVVNKIPFLLLLMGYLASLGYDYYTFVNDTTSTLGAKKAELAQMKASNAKLQVKVTELEKFAQTLEQKKVDLRHMVEEFQQVSGALSDHLDTPLFMKMVITEARKGGLKVESLKPKGATEKEFYLETSFDFSYRGFFSQLLVFLQRLASTTEIIKIDDIEIKPDMNASSRFVELRGNLQIRTYTYLSAKADAMVKQMAANSEVTAPAVALSKGGAPAKPTDSDADKSKAAGSSPAASAVRPAAGEAKP